MKKNRRIEDNELELYTRIGQKWMDFRLKPDVQPLEKVVKKSMYERLKDVLSKRKTKT
jgi:hypothetical protein